MRYSRIPVSLALLVVLGACERLNEYFEGAQDRPLPGDRISVINLQRTLRPDPRITDVSVRLPRPYLNEDWPQAGGHPTHAMHHLTLAEAPSQVWRVSAGTGAGDLTRLTAVPIVADGQVFILDSEGSVAAHRADNGRRIWRYSIVPDTEDPGVA
jgi:outer membrane protein assembly factor BamB